MAAELHIPAEPPVEADALEIEQLLQAAFDAIESVALICHELRLYDGGESHLGEVDLEHIVALALIRDTLDMNIGRFQRFSAIIAEGIGSLAAIRGTQTLRARDADKPSAIAERVREYGNGVTT